jgi:N-methylhydantoinase B
MNEGCLRPITFIAPEGCFVNPLPPAPGGGRAVTVHRQFETVAGALAAAVPERAVGASSQFCNTVAGGYDVDGNPYLLWDLVIGGFAARSTKDGTEGLCSVLNARNLPIEISELWAPVAVERLEFVTDTGGPGEYRGACGVRKDIRFLGRENRVTPISDRNVYPPHGVHGGGHGACGEIVLNPNRKPRKLHPKAVHEVQRDDVVRFQVSGAGGYGRQLARSLEAVVEDVLEGYVSAEAAARDYGVVLAGDGSLDRPATGVLREQLTSAEGSLA